MLTRNARFALFIKASLAALVLAGTPQVDAERKVTEGAATLEAAFQAHSDPADAGRRLA